MKEKTLSTSESKFVKTLLKLLKYISISLGFVSLIFFLFSLYFLPQIDDSVSFVNTVNSIYNVISTYSGLYKFTFVVCAFWVTLNQLEISFNNYKTTLNQVKFIQEDILDRRKKDTTNETLKQCNFF